MLGFLVRAAAAGQIEWHVVGHYLTFGAILDGLGRTVFISVLSLLIGIVLGVVFAVMRLSRNPVVSTVAWLYVWLFRGTPVYLQLLLWFNIALIFPTVHLFGLVDTNTVNIVTPLAAALLGLGLNEGAYVTEIVRAGLLSVEQGQSDAAAALGLTDQESLRMVVLPQAMRVIIPPVGNEFIGLLKTSALASAISYNEMLFQAQRIYEFNTRVMELLLVAAFWYLVVVSVFSIGQYYLERRFARGAARALPPTPLERLRANLSVLHTKTPAAPTGRSDRS